MTKKTGLFDVDFSVTNKELTASIKGEKATTAHYKFFSEALGTIINQMQVSDYRPRTIKDYDTVDVYANLISSCPVCHRILHHGRLEDKRKVINGIYNLRIDRLNACGINFALAELNKTCC